MVNNEIKEIIKTKVKQKIAVSNLQKEFEIEEIHRKKIMYTFTSNAAVIILVIGIVFGIKNVKNHLTLNSTNEIADIQITENIEDKIIFNESLQMVSTDVDGEWHDSNLNEEFTFLNFIILPNGYAKSRQGKVYIREEVTGEYTKLNQYCSIYSFENEYNPYIEVDFSKDSDILGCFHYAELNDYEYSIINGINVKLIRNKTMIEDKINGEAIFECNGYKFYIHAYEIEKDEFVVLVKSIIEGTTKK